MLPTISAGQGTQWVIADLHLTDEGGPGVPAFVAWLAGIPAEQELWILGDLFEYWLGPAHLTSLGFQPVKNALNARAQAGGVTRIVPGNRDFLLDRAFEEASGATLCPDGARLERGTENWLLVHGDDLCTEDHGYQRLRRVLRSRVTRGCIAALPTFAKRGLARRLRRASKSAVPRKDPARIAMQPAAARNSLEAASCQTLLCGHAHGYRESEPGPGLRWFVLDAFGEGPRDVLRLDPGQPPEFLASKSQLGKSV